jgi:hypothetical protein
MVAALTVRPLRELFSSLNCKPLKVEALLLVATRAVGFIIPEPESCTDAMAKPKHKMGRY